METQGETFDTLNNMLNNMLKDYDQNKHLSQIDRNKYSTF